MAPSQSEEMSGKWLVESPESPRLLEESTRTAGSSVPSEGVRCQKFLSLNQTRIQKKVDGPTVGACGWWSQESCRAACPLPPF